MAIQILTIIFHGIVKNLNILLLSRKNYVYNFCKDLNNKLINYYCYDRGKIRYFEFPLLKKDSFSFNGSKKAFIVNKNVVNERLHQENIYNCLSHVSNIYIIVLQIYVS